MVYQSVFLIFMKIVKPVGSGFHGSIGVNRGQRNIAHEPRKCKIGIGERKRHGFLLNLTEFSFVSPQVSLFYFCLQNYHYDITRV